MRLSYVIAFVSDMPAAVAFYRDVLGLPLHFESPGWSEFETGTTRLGLHPASAQHPHGTLQLGLAVDDMQRFATEMKAKGYRFTREPTVEHGTVLAAFVDRTGTEFSVSAPLPG